MYVKTAILFAGFAGSYVLLVFGAQSWWQGLLLAMLLGLFAAEIGFNIQHDGGHQAYSNVPWINQLMAMTLELIGGSSYVWRWKHVVIHHSYVNITGYDTDIDLGLLGRLRRIRSGGGHRWQHLYLWPLYGLLPSSGNWLMISANSSAAGSVTIRSLAPRVGSWSSSLPAR